MGKNAARFAVALTGLTVLAGVGNVEATGVIGCSITAWWGFYDWNAIPVGVSIFQGSGLLTYDGFFTGDQCAHLPYGTSSGIGHTIGTWSGDCLLMTATLASGTSFTILPSAGVIVGLSPALWDGAGAFVAALPCAMSDAISTMAWVGVS